MEASLSHTAICQLLGRAAHVPDFADLRKAFQGQTILVTGAAGSIGSELALQLARLEPGLVVLLDQAESPLHELSLVLADAGAAAFVVQLADITNQAQMRQVFARYRPGIVFHAAAYKHVPLLETHAAQAIETNILATRLLADLAREFSVRKFVLLSTDKAVEPASVMGATKRVCELYMVALCQQQQREQQPDPVQYIITRFGNVAGSTGSVIPRFLDQIGQGGPVTITHPDVARFFMTPYEACHLVLEAAAIGKGGEVFVFEMGDEIKIAGLAQQLIRQAGPAAAGIRIVETGLRPGEKLSEKLFFDSETIVATSHPSIRQARQPQTDRQPVIKAIDKLAAQLFLADNATLKMELSTLLPEYTPELL